LGWRSLHGCGIFLDALHARLLSRDSWAITSYWSSIRAKKLEFDLSQYCEYNWLYIFITEVTSMIKIFDLDGTVIDSSHRTRFLADGSLDLAYWQANATPRKIAADTLLPLAKQMQSAYARGNCLVMVCTARVMSASDYLFLDMHGLQYHAITSRPEGETLPDFALKLYALHGLCTENGWSWAKFRKMAIMFDDNLSVIDALTAEGIRVYNSTTLNGRLAA
tara:strand:- start:494 stop:1156 length:663 start_codon:yes stop_codon:yes gene_type:complete